MPPKGKSKLAAVSTIASTTASDAKILQQPSSATLSYASRLSVHLSLLGFTALVLPRSSSLFIELPAPQSSLDRPEPAFLQPLTSSPALTTAWMCAGAFVLLAAWAAPMRTWVSGEQGRKPGEDIAKRNNDRAESFRGAALMTVAGTAAFSGLLTLFGAPLLMYHVRTVLLSLLLSLLTLWTPAYTFGIPKFAVLDAVRFRWTRVFCDFSPQSDAERAVFFPSAGALLGAWVGAFPIALDWDRPWQAWPLTPAFGAILGYSVGSLLALVLIVLPPPAPELSIRTE